MSRLNHKDISIIFMNIELTIEYYVEEIDEIINLINGNDYDSQMIREELNDVKILMNEYDIDLTREFNNEGEKEIPYYLPCISAITDIARKTSDMNIQDRLYKLTMNLKADFREYITELSL